MSAVAAPFEAAPVEAAAPDGAEVEVDSWSTLLEETFLGWFEGRLPQVSDSSARSFVHGWLEEDATERLQITSLLRRRLEGPYLDTVHGSWIAAELPKDPLLRASLVGALPAEARRKIAAEAELASLPPGALAGLSTQDWLRDWWLQRLQGRIDCPRPLPWASDKSRPITYLYRLEARILGAVLRDLGLQTLSDVLPLLPRKHAAEHVFSLPPRELRRLENLACGRGSRHGIEPSVYRQWILPELEHPSADGCLATRLGTLAAAALAVAEGRKDDAKRLAYALPRPLGRRALTWVNAEVDGLAPADGGERRRRLEEAVARAEGRELPARRRRPSSAARRAVESELHREAA